MKNFRTSLMILGLLAFPATRLQAQAPRPFDKIRVSSNASVTLSQGETASITLEDEPAIDISKEYTITNDGWLVITGNPSDDIHVTAPVIKAVEITGTGKLETASAITVSDIELNIKGAGKLEMELTADKVKSEISGAGKIELEGSAREMILDISGAGKIDAEHFKVGTVVANISGSGKCLIDVTDSLTSNISGSGSVYYVTPPQHVNSQVSGIGNVTDINSASHDTTRITIGDKKILIIDGEGKDMRTGFRDAIHDARNDVTHAHWAGFELGINMLMDKDFKNDAPAGYAFLDQKVEKSIAVNFNLIDYEIKLYRRNIMLVTGLGFTINNYRFTSDDYLAAGTDSVTSITGQSLSKNKLVAQYLTVPLLLEFNTSQNPKKTFHAAFGMIGGLRIASHVKVITNNDGDDVKQKYHDDFNLNTFRYDVTARLGYRNFTVFGSYDLAGLFKDNKGPELFPFTAGVRLVGW